MALISHGEWLDRYGDELGESVEDERLDLTYTVLPAWAAKDAWTPLHALRPPPGLRLGSVPQAVQTSRTR